MDLKEYQAFVDYLLSHKLPINTIQTQQQNFIRQATYNYIENGILFRKNRKSTNQLLRVITLPDRDKILYVLHSSPLGGYFGIKRTIEKAKELYY